MKNNNNNNIRIKIIIIRIKMITINYLIIFLKNNFHNNDNIVNSDGNVEYGDDDGDDSDDNENEW